MSGSKGAMVATLRRRAALILVGGAWWAAPKFYPVIPRDPHVMVYKPGFDQHVDSRNPASPTVRTLPLGVPQGISEHSCRALFEEAQALGPLPRASDHYLATLREKAGVPQPPEPPWQIRAIHPQGPRPAAPGSPSPGNPP